MPRSAEGAIDDAASGYCLMAKAEAVTAFNVAMLAMISVFLPVFRFFAAGTMPVKAGYASSTSRTLRAKAVGVNGFCKKATSSCNTP
jgi:hypothetical protein